MSGGEKTLAKEQEAWAGDTEEAWVTGLRRPDSRVDVNS